MTTPSDPQREGQGTSGQGGYGGQAPYPGPYGGEPHPGQPQQGPYPDPGQQGGYAYNPYNAPYPAGQYPAGTGEVGPDPAGRPGAMVASLVLLTLSALPFVLFGLLFLIRPVAFTGQPELERALADAGVSFETFVSAAMVGVGIILVVALLYVVFAVLAFLGRNWARIVLTVMTGMFTLLILLGLVTGTTDTAGLLLTLAILGAAVVGTALMYVAPSSRFFANPRR